ncbi:MULTISPECIES: hypothetical protein [Bacillus]|uniref:hypothetical protein n=1 Tax=Bacillus TaxID=1386 RepID=UPI00031827EA|nr:MULTISPECIES: hypothetical protein [Bacillus]
MKPLTAKEVEYIVDSMSNEDLLIKQCVSAAAQSKNIAVQQICVQLLVQHKKHYQDLLTLLQQHTAIAPKTVQEANQMEQMQKLQTAQNQNQQIMAKLQQANQGFQHPLN